MRQLKKKDITPRILSLEEIVRQQEMAKYGKQVSVFMRKPVRNTSTLISA